MAGYEAGKSAPNYELLVSIAKLFQVGPGYFFPGDSGNNTNSVAPEAVPNAVPNPVPNTKKTLQKAQEPGYLTQPSVQLAAEEQVLYKSRVAFNPTIIPVVTDRLGNTRIVELDSRAAAGLPQGFQDPEYYADKPTIQLNGLSKPGAAYFSLEVVGESMSPRLLPGDHVICTQLFDPAEIREEYVHVVLTPNEVTVKRVLNRIKERGELVLKSDNEAYPPRYIKADEVLAIFKVERFWSASIPNQNRDDRRRLNDLEREQANHKRALAYLAGKLNLGLTDLLPPTTEA